MIDPISKKRQPSPELECADIVCVEFTLKALPPDRDPHGGMRYGRPVPSPSLPPEEARHDQPPSSN